MKQTLHLRLGHQLSMTPQLQQAIKLLQMSTLDLQQEIQQALESNIMLELESEELGSFSLDAPLQDKKRVDFLHQETWKLAQQVSALKSYSIRVMASN